MYGLISFWTRLRVREIGVRVAVGASRGDIVRMVVLHALRSRRPVSYVPARRALAQHPLRALQSE